MLTDKQLTDAERYCKEGMIERPLLALRPRIDADMSEALLNVVQECQRLRAESKAQSERTNAAFAYLRMWTGDTKHLANAEEINVGNMDVDGNWTTNPGKAGE